MASGQANDAAGWRGTDLASGRRGRRFKSGHPDHKVAGQLPDMRSSVPAQACFVLFWEPICPILGATAASKRTARAWSLDGQPLLGISVLAVLDMPLDELLRSWSPVLRGGRATAAACCQENRDACHGGQDARPRVGQHPRRPRPSACAHMKLAGKSQRTPALTWSDGGAGKEARRWVIRRRTCPLTMGGCW